jgi:hypothetical protein
MAGELGLGKAELERRFAASLLRSGFALEEVQRVARILVDDFYRDFAAKRLVIRIERSYRRILSPEDRKRIYLRWWTDRIEDHVLCTEHQVSHATLWRIKQEGREHNW